MYKDPTKFRDRFQSYKNGKMPYKNGRPIEDEEFESFRQTLPDNQKQLGDYRTRRYWELNDKPKTFGEAIGRGMYNLGDSKQYGQYGIKIPAWHANSVAYDQSSGNYEFMKPNTHSTRWMEDVYGYWGSGMQDFRENYKLQKGPVYDKYVPKKNVYELPKFGGGKEPIDGGTPFGVVVTGRDRRPAWKRMYQNPRLGDTSQYYNGDAIRNITDWAPGIGDVSQGFDAYHAAKNGNYGEAAMLGGLLFLPNIVEKPLRYVGRKIFLPVRERIADKASDYLANTQIVKRAMNYAMHMTDAANPIEYILRDVGIKKYGAKNPSNVSAKEIADFLKDSNKDKTKLKQVASYVLFGKNKDKVIKDNTGITGFDYDTSRTFSTSPSTGFIGPKESVLFGKDMTAGRIESTPDYGIHSAYIASRPDQTPRKIYNTDLPYVVGLRSVDDDQISKSLSKTLSVLDDSMPIQTPRGIGSYDAGGHRVELGKGVDGRYYMRGQDLYKFDAVDYAKKHLDPYNDGHTYATWAMQHPLLSFGLQTVQKAVKPIMVRSRWTRLDDVANSSRISPDLKKQILDIYDPNTGSLLFNEY